MNPVVRASWVAAAELPDPHLVAAHLAALGKVVGSGRGAVYELLTPDEDFQRLLDEVGTIDRPLAAPPTYVVLSEIASLRDAVAGEGELRTLPAERAGEVVERSLLLSASAVRGTRDADFPELGPVIQMGQFDMPDVDAEWDLAEWYEFQRLAPFETMAGGIRAQRLVGVCGPTKFGVLYEFDSRDTHRNAFVAVLEQRAHRDGDEMGGVVRRTLHTSVSPTVGQRLPG
jgi:hypothetical protein